MAIWFRKDLVMDNLEALGIGTMTEAIGIRWKELGEDFLKATMPVDARTRQPYGFLHGGASCVLAETLGSVGSALVIDQARYYCVGIEINANHIRSAKSGIVTGTAKPLHIGRTTHVWDIRIEDEEEKLICASRITIAILEKKS